MNEEKRKWISWTDEELTRQYEQVTKVCELSAEDVVKAGLNSLTKQKDFAKKLKLMKEALRNI